MFKWKEDEEKIGEKQLPELNLSHSQYEIFPQLSPQPISKKNWSFQGRKNKN